MELVQKSLFDKDSTCDMVSKKFIVKDVFFNNGIVNLYQFLEKNSFEIIYEMFENNLILNIKDEENTFLKLFSSFLDNYKIIYATKNKDLYFDESLNNFTFKERYNIIGASSGNDIKNSYIYKSAEELGYTKESLQDKYLNFCLSVNVTPSMKTKDIENSVKKELKITNKKVTSGDNRKIISYLFNNKKQLNVPDGSDKIRIYSHISELTKNSANNYFLKENPPKIDSKIHPFETKNKTLFSMLKSQPNHHRLDKWDSLIYHFGNRTNRYFFRSHEKKSSNNSVEYIIIPNSSNLKSLNLIKKDLQISNESLKNNNKIDIGTNIDFYGQLSKDEIKKSGFFIIKSIEEFEIKFFMYIFSKIFHIEKNYKDLEDDELLALFDEDTFSYSKMLYEALKDISFVSYSFDKNLKYSLSEYTKVYPLMVLFLKLKENDLFSYFGELIYQVSISKKKKKNEKKEEYNQNIKKLAIAILNFKPIENILVDVSYDILKTHDENKKNKVYKRLGYQLSQFISLYLIEIKKGEYMELHEESKNLGQQIGNFVSKYNDKDLLFKLRNIKNFKQMISFFKDVEFYSLQKDDKNENYLDIKKILKILKNEKENWDLVRDYIAIYAVEQFKYKAYKESKEGDK